jgi:hypothetical protein
MLADLPPFSQSKRAFFSTSCVAWKKHQKRVVEVVGRHVAGELLEPDLRWLPPQALHSSQAAMEGWAVASGWERAGVVSGWEGWMTASGWDGLVAVAWGKPWDGVGMGRIGSSVGVGGIGGGVGVTSVGGSVGNRGSVGKSKGQVVGGVGAVAAVVGGVGAVGGSDGRRRRGRVGGRVTVWEASAIRGGR